MNKVGKKYLCFGGVENSNGFTLLELIVGTFVISLIVTVVASFFSFFFSTYNFTFQQGTTISEAQVAVRDLKAELREARTSDDGAYALVTADDGEIEFYSDVDDDGRVERVRYYLNGANLERGVVEPGSPPLVYDPATESVSVISDKVVNGANPVFFYYNGNWPGDVVNNPLVQNQRLLNSRLIRIVLQINTDPNQQDDFELATQVMVRNLKTN